MKESGEPDGRSPKRAGLFREAAEIMIREWRGVESEKALPGRPLLCDCGVAASPGTVAASLVRQELEGSLSEGA